MAELTPYLWLFPVGLVVGTVGTVLGAGGGFLLVPILMLAYPDDPPDTITSISLAVVFFNALSGSIAYARKGRIDYRSGLAFAAASVPGAILGAFTTPHLPRRLFGIVFGLLLLAFSARVLFTSRNPGGPQRAPAAGGWSRELVERDGTRHSYSFRPATGIVLSLGIGYVSSLLGIGGGIIHVPAMVGLLSFPVHVATATSHFTLCIMALAGSGAHWLNGALEHSAYRIAPLAAGVLLGAPLGARLSNRVKGTAILRGLAMALAIVGLRMLTVALRAAP